MLWSAWSLEAKLVTIISCGIVIALSVLIVICFLVPDTWWTCPWSGISVHFQVYYSSFKPF